MKYLHSSSLCIQMLYEVPSGAGKNHIISECGIKTSGNTFKQEMYVDVYPGMLLSRRILEAFHEHDVAIHLAAGSKHWKLRAVYQHVIMGSRSSIIQCTQSREVKS